MPKRIESDMELEQVLACLLETDPRPAERAAQGKAAFLQEAGRLAESSSRPVSPAVERRHIHWMHALQKTFSLKTKEPIQMISTIGTLLLAFSLVFSGTAVAASQSSLPDQAVLYPVKLWTEDLRVGLTHQPEAQFALAAELANRRTSEIQAMLAGDRVPGDAVLLQMQTQMDQALALAAGQPDEQARQSLERLREQLQTQAQVFAQMNDPADPAAEALLAQTRQMIQDRLNLCVEGIQDPAALRQRLQLGGRPPLAPAGSGYPAPIGSQTGDGNPWTTGTPTPLSGYGPGPGEDSGGNNPWTTGTPTPLSGYGPGPGEDGSGGNNPWTTGTPTPLSSYGPGPGEDGSGGNNPWTTGTPTPGSGYGSGDSGQPQAPTASSGSGSETGPGEPGGNPTADGGGSEGGTGGDSDSGGGQAGGSGGGGGGRP